MPKVITGNISQTLKNLPKNHEQNATLKTKELNIDPNPFFYLNLVKQIDNRRSNDFEILSPSTIEIKRPQEKMKGKISNRYDALTGSSKAKLHVPTVKHTCSFQSDYQQTYFDNREMKISVREPLSDVKTNENQQKDKQKYPGLSYFQAEHHKNKEIKPRQEYINLVDSIQSDYYSGSIREPSKVVFKASQELNSIKEQNYKEPIKRRNQDPAHKVQNDNHRCLKRVQTKNSAISCANTLSSSVQQKMTLKDYLKLNEITSKKRHIQKTDSLMNSKDAVGCQKLKHCPSFISCPDDRRHRKIESSKIEIKKALKEQLRKDLKNLHQELAQIIQIITESDQQQGSNPSEQELIRIYRSSRLVKQKIQKNQEQLLRLMNFHKGENIDEQTTIKI